MGLRNKNKIVSTRAKRMTLLDDNVPFHVKEAFKKLRANLIFALSTQKTKLVAVTSSLASEGKSTTAANIAITLSETGSKVLLIDADLRKPIQHRVFKVKNKIGLSTLLGGLHSFKEVLNSSVIPGLDILSSGPIPPNPSEMLSSENMKVLLDELSKFYDYVIIDTPPVNVVSDALGLANSIAGFVMVAKQSTTPRDAFAQAVNSIEFADGTVLGAVVNNVDTGNAKYKYKYGSYSYGYGKESEK